MAPKLINQYVLKKKESIKSKIGKFNNKLKHLEFTNNSKLEKK